MTDTGRLSQLDGLRAVAALSVVGFHYTARYDAALVHMQPLPFSLAWGHLGVELFFIISGFVILMTVDRARSPADFVFSGVSRLFPTYWVAVLLTALTLRAVQMPGYERSAFDIAVNLTMVPNQFGVASIDGAYWSLGIELMFYAWVLLLWRLGALRRPALAIAAACAVSLAANLSEQLGLRWPSAVKTLWMTQWSPWFALGAALYAHHARGLPERVTLGLVALAVVAIGCGGQPVVAALAVVACLLVHGAARGSLPILGIRPLVAIGRVSYPLYLVHQALGWWVIVSLQQAGVPALGSILIAASLAIGAAFLLNRVVEEPVMAALRAWWRRRRATRGIPLETRPDAEPDAGLDARPDARPDIGPGNGRGTGPSDRPWIVGAAAVLLALSGGVTVVSVLRDRTPLPHEAIRAVDPARHPSVPCDVGGAAGGAARVILVLGQSNAASHAAPIPPPATGGTTLRVFAEGRCVESGDPLPGTTGGGSSLWTAVQEAAAAADPSVRLTWAPLAVGATAIARWVGADPVNDRLTAHLRSLRDAGLRIDRIVWQQGESDARDGTDAAVYLQGLHALRARLDAHGVTAPMHVARSTYCRRAGTGAIGRALTRHEASLVAARILPGPDTDALLGATNRRDDCHFTDEGRRRAAGLWHEVLAAPPRAVAAGRP
jgi:peptidoglycan/LPS O-acetylase OafA/YrhL